MQPHSANRDWSAYIIVTRIGDKLIVESHRGPIGEADQIIGLDDFFRPEAEGAVADVDAEAACCKESLMNVYFGLLLAYGADPTTLNVGYAPIQPVAYSHALHVGKLGLDCRYCHTTVEKAAMAALPPTEVCMNCHKAILPDSPKLGLVEQSYVDGTPIPWIKVHDLAD